MPCRGSTRPIPSSALVPAASAPKAQDAGTLAASTVSFWEVALLVDRGRVALPRGVDTWRSELLARLLEIPLAGDIAIRA
jgi:PIN domain nuclease of toxin-antitoxin system